MHSVNWATFQKPHLRRVGGLWCCTTGLFMGWGLTPWVAWLEWTVACRAPQPVAPWPLFEPQAPWVGPWCGGPTTADPLPDLGYSVIAH